MHTPFFGEFMGTLVLILLGNGVVANVLLKKALGENSGWIVICTGWGLAVMAGVFTAIACGSPGAHINPAVTLGMAVRDGNFDNVLPFIAAQMLGAIVGATLVWLHYLPHWAVTPDKGAKLACFCTGPAIPSTGANILAEVIGTFSLVMIIGTIFSKSVSLSGPAPGLGPFLVGATVWVIGLCLGGATGFPINPARDLGPRIAHSILPIAGKGGSNWGYAAIPIIGEVIGGVLAGAFIKAAL
jgi:glycerol uptake facilitator protein